MQVIPMNKALVLGVCVLYWIAFLLVHSESLGEQSVWKTVLMLIYFQYIFVAFLLKKELLASLVDLRPGKNEVVRVVMFLCSICAHGYGLLFDFDSIL